MNHVKEYCDLICGENKLLKNVSYKASANQVAVETQAVCGEETLNKKSVLEDVSLEKCDTAVKSVTPRHVKANVTTDSVTAIKHEDNSYTKTSSYICCQDRVTQDFVTDCHVNESVTNPVGLTDSAESEKFADIDHLTVEQDVANRNEHTITSEKPDQSSLNDRDEQEFNAEFVKQSDFSCLPLVPVFLDDPTHVFAAHQSGVNAVSLVKSQVAGQYLMVSGGDDSSLHAAVFDLVFNDNDTTKVHVIRDVTEPSAHTSSVTGVKALNSGLVISSSVDQRLVLWEMVSGEQVPFAFRPRTVEIVDIADVQDLEVWGERDDGLVAAVCGVGLQTFSLLRCT